MTLVNNPYECGLDRFFKLGKSAEYMSREALEKFASNGVDQKIIHLKLVLRLSMFLKHSLATHFQLKCKESAALEKYVI